MLYLTKLQIIYSESIYNLPHQPQVNLKNNSLYKIYK
jgi:hypothetical protein